MGRAAETKRASGSTDTQGLRWGFQVREAKSNRKTRPALSQKLREQGAARETAWRRKAHSMGTTRSLNNLARSWTAKVETWRKEKTPEPEVQTNLSRVWGEKTTSGSAVKGEWTSQRITRWMFSYIANTMCCITATWPGLVFYCYIYLIFIRTKKGAKKVYRFGNWAFERCHDLETMWPLTTGRAWCEEKEHWKSWVRGRRSEDEEHDSQTWLKERKQRNLEMQEWTSEKATFRWLVLDQMKRKLQKKSLTCTTWRKPTTYLCNFFLTNTAKMLWMHC